VWHQRVLQVQPCPLIESLHLLSQTHWNHEPAARSRARQRLGVRQSAGAFREQADQSKAPRGLAHSKTWRPIGGSSIASEPMALWRGPLLVVNANTIEQAVRLLGQLEVSGDAGHGDRRGAGAEGARDVSPVGCAQARSLLQLDRRRTWPGED